MSLGANETSDLPTSKIIVVSSQGLSSVALLLLLCLNRSDLRWASHITPSGGLGGEPSPESPICKAILIRNIGQFSNAYTGAVHPALDRADFGPADCRCLLVAHPFCSDEEKHLALLDRELAKGCAEIVKIKMPMLLWRGGKHACHQAIRVLDLALPLAQRSVEMVAQNGEQLCLQVCPWREAIQFVQAPHDGLLYKIIRLIHLTRKRDRKGTKVRDGFEQAGTKFVRQR
jgi:hypothetical protein